MMDFHNLQDEVILDSLTKCLKPKQTDKTGI